MDYSTMTKEQLQWELEKQVEIWENLVREQRSMARLAQEASERISSIEHYYHHLG